MTNTEATLRADGGTERIHFTDEEDLLPTDSVARGTFQLVQFDPKQYDDPWAVYENQAGVLTLLGDGDTAGEALEDAGKALDREDGPRGDGRV